MHGDVAASAIVGTQKLKGRFMKTELQEHLFEKYFELFVQKDLSPQETSMCWGMECGNGWYNIIDKLCGFIEQRLKNTQEEIERLEGYLECFDLTDDQSKMYKSRIERLNGFPKSINITQIKEKYGTLRFYIDSVDPEIDAAIDFAESISEVTCELCGRPGKINEGAWLSVRCETCRNK